jgi:LmbE family N-acetylglucosaminyl deacetylase
MSPLLPLDLMRAGDILRAFEALPFAALDAIVGPGAPLVLAPHADDESLGCGGLIASCCARDTPPVVVIATDGCGSHPGSRAYPPARLRAVREQEAREAVRLLGGRSDDVFFLGLPDTAAPLSGPVFEAAVDTLVHLMAGRDCRVLLAPWRHDPHCDHEAADVMARAVALRAGIRHLSYPVWGWTLPPDQPLPVAPPAGRRLDIAPHVAAKRAAIAAHASQYSDLITDDPKGFRLPPDLLAIFERPYEVFIEP